VLSNKTGALGLAVAAAAVCSLNVAVVHAGGSSEQSVLIIDPTDPASIEVGHHYAAARNIPASNIVYMPPGAADFTQFGTTLDALLGELAVRGVEHNIDLVVIAPAAQFRVAAPGLITDSCFPVSNFSLTGCYSMAFVRSEVLSGTLNSQHPNRYFSTAYSTFTLDSQLPYFGGTPSGNAGARRYLAAGMLGYTGERGNTVQELKAMIDRSVAADGTRPAANFYFMSTTDVARNVRSPQFATVVTTINNSLGGTASTLSGVLPPAAPSVMGVMTGIADFDWSSSGSTILPGAFCDHLTSYGATFTVADQTKVSAWIRAGASASAGAIEEPCNYPGKFPHARIHAYYRQGMAIGEAYLRSLEYLPFQGLLYGDPLTRAYAWPPNLTVSGVPTGPVVGQFVINPVSSATLSGRNIDRTELFIDGVSQGTVQPGGTFTVNTHLLDDGWHEVRILTWDNSQARHTRSWSGSILVANDGLQAAMTPPTNLSPALNDAVVFGLSAPGSGLRELRLLANGRVVASRLTNGPVTLFGRILGPGRVKVQCEAVFNGNYVSRSEPVELNIAAEGSPPAATAPVAHSYLKRMKRNRGAVVELPAAFADQLGGATFQLVSPASNASVSLSGSAALVIPGPNISGNDTFQFRVITPSGTSNTATVTLWYACEADFDGNGAAGVPDIFAFLSAWFAGNPVADFDNSGGAPSVPDIFAFLSAWFAGCQ
jgi:hypothetical protein